MKGIVQTLVLLLIVGCSATKYVPETQSLLVKNRVIIDEPKGADVNRDELASYIQQHPNRKLFGLGIYLGFYNSTDTSKHSGWHKFWREKVGEAPTILDSTKIAKTVEMMGIYLESMGFLNASIKDTIEISDKRKSQVKYQIKSNEPYTIASVKYVIDDDFIRPIVEQDTVNSLLKVSKRFERKILEDERMRITTNLRNQGFWGFNQNYISYVADSSRGDNTVALTVELKQLVAGKDSEGQDILMNHPIYRISDITLNSNFDASASAEQQKTLYDTIEYNGVSILYKDRLLIRERILLEQLGMSPGEIFDQQGIEQTYSNVRSLGFNSSIIFSPLPIDSSNIVYVTTFDGEAYTTQRELSCMIQCTPIVRQAFSLDFETSTNESYLSLALKFGYQNRNLLRGAEDFNVSLRGAYEFLWSTEQQNSYEFEIATSLSVPRFWLPISPELMREFKNSSTELSLSYSIQNRPDYKRSILSAVFGYGWTLKNGARFTINPADVNLVSVPWIDSTFLADIENPYLRNSYESQLISGLSASYYYNTNPNPKLDGFAFRVTGDINGNLFYGLSSLFGATKHTTSAGDSYYNLFGLRYAQYVRLMAEVSNRVNVGRRSQIAWRFLIGAGYAYGNSQVLPFERQYFAGGGNSMRGWQVRTLGPGGVLLDREDESYPNQLGDMRLEANFEYRVSVVGGLNLAFFVDCGNIWMNAAGTEDIQRFKLNTFYKQLALNTGAGIRYDLNFFILRLDWGLKLRNPNAPDGQQWFTDLALNRTALHFAIGLPF